MSTPSQILAAKIAERLVSEGLVTAAASKALEQTLADGTLRAEDWRLPIELAAQKVAKT